MDDLDRLAATVPACARSTTGPPCRPTTDWSQRRPSAPTTPPTSGLKSNSCAHSNRSASRRSAPARIIDPPEQVYAQGELSGTPARLDLDLTWTTDGVPYHYDLTTRYEIPCLVSGTVTVDGETFTVDGQGQRDHSWGVRDWWAFGWCWCSMRLDDGTRVHLADIRMDIGIPVFFGYIQQPEHGLVLPATALSVTEDVGPHGLPSKARIEIAATDSDSNPEDGSDLMQIGLDVTPVAFGPVLLRNDDGRTSRFPRAMVTCRTDDGRTGAGWIEWNQPDPAPAAEAT